MEIYIVRHAIAEEVSADGSDEGRELTPEGKKKMKEAASGFARMEKKIDRIFTSPLARARQTAEIVGEAIHKKIDDMKELAPGHTPAQVCQRLQQFKGLESVMLVGHEPNCSELASYLLGGNDRLSVEFKKGAICIVESREMKPGTGDLLLHLSPATLRLMAG